MTKHVDPTPRLKPEAIKALKGIGFTHVVIVNRPISAVIPGGVVGAFKSGSDAKRFATVLNKLYGCKDGYRGVSL